MSLLSIVLLPAAESGGHEEVWELPMSAWAYGGIAIGAFLLLLLVAWFFRNAGHTRFHGSDLVEHGTIAPGHDPRTSEGPDSIHPGTMRDQGRAQGGARGGASAVPQARTTYGAGNTGHGGPMGSGSSTPGGSGSAH